MAPANYILYLHFMHLKAFWLKGAAAETHFTLLARRSIRRLRSACSLTSKISLVNKDLRVMIKVFLL